jgi:hypothetical protein
VSRSNRSRLAELVLGLFFLAECVLFIVVFRSVPLDGFFVGRAAALVFTETALLLSLLAATALGLWAGKPWASWTLVAYLVVCAAVHCFPVGPNGPEYKRVLRDVEAGNVEMVGSAAEPSSYPEALNYLLYLAASAYLARRGRGGQGPHGETQGVH